jgi:hypothetical protein
MADNQISVDDMLSILDGGVATKPVDINVKTMSVANEPAADISSVVNFLDGDTGAPAPEINLPDTYVEPTVELEEPLDAKPQPTRMTSRDAGYIDIMLPSADDTPFEAAEPQERLSRVEETKQESLLSFWDSSDTEGKDNFRKQLVESLRAPDPQTQKPTISGYALSMVANSSDVGMKAVLGIVDGITLGTSGAVDAIENSLEALGDDTLTYKGINAAVNQFGRKKLAESPRELANQIANGFGSFFEFSDTLPVLGLTGAVQQAVSGGRLARKAASQTKDLREAIRNNADIARGASMEAAEQARKLAAETAAKNADVAEELIKAFEARTGKSISTEKNGRLTLDYDKARQAGVETLEEVSADSLELATGADKLTQPILQPEKFDAIVSIAADYKQKFPDAFDGNRTIIDSLFDLTVNRELVGGQELIDNLNKYGLSFEDYILTVVGSGSEAGKVLNKLSQIKRARPVGEATQEAANIATKQEGRLRQAVMRLENVRRGGLVSQLATAARNLTSAGVRAPLESLGNVMDTAIYRASNDGVLAGVGELFSGQNWKDSFADMKYIFSRSDVAKGYTDFLLSRPELASQYDRMFNNINEIQKLTGRGSGTAFDRVLSPMEDVVDFLNTPNRWQEHLIRRGVFFGELQRLTRNEYKIDLIDALQSGKLQDLLNDASGVKPENARSFLNLVDDAVTKSLDVTYAKMPEIPVFRSTSQFIVRNGLTTVLPFPRFMFNSMELMGQYAAGASIPLTRKVASLVTAGRVGSGPLTAKDRQRITRNMMGMAAIGAAYQYRTSEDVPADYKEMYTSEGVVMDTSPQYPMRQFLYLGEATKRTMDGTFDDWFDAREFAETFAGSNIRVGSGNAILEEVAALADGTDLTKGEATGKLTGRLLGEYLSTWAVPFAQLIESQRAVGERGLEYKDVREDPTLDGLTTFFNEVKRPFEQRGIAITAEEEAEMPSREFLFTESKQRVNPMARVLLGLNQSTKDAEYGEYFTRLGFNEYDLGSTSDVPTVQRWENKNIREVLPIIAEFAQSQEKTLRAEYADKSDMYKANFTEQEHVNNNVIPLVRGMVRDVRTDLKEIPVGAEDEYTNAIVQYRRIPKEFRKLSTNYFVDRFDRVPDPTSAKDLQALTMIGVTLRKAYNK